MRLKLAATALAFAFAGNAAADEMVFTVAGTNANGSAYTGEVRVTEIENSGVAGDAFKVVWTIGDAVFEGVGLVGNDDRKSLVVSFPAESAVGVMVAVLADDGSAKGSWVDPRYSAPGSETWTPKK